MSFNQSRGEKTEGHLKKSGRSGNSGYHRGFSGGGGKGGGGSSAPAPPLSSSSSSSSTPPNLSTNRSFKRSGNGHGQGGQSRVNVNPSSTNSEGVAASLAVQNGAHAQQHPLHGFSEAPAPIGAKPVDTFVPRNAHALPRAPSSQSASGASDSAAPKTPAKGDASRSFTLQFGTISPGVMNGVQIPARTSSAPPNLDEQIRNQALQDSFRALPTLPIPSAPKQQLQKPRKDVGGINQSNSGESHLPTQAKKDVPIQVQAPPNAAAQKSSVLPIPAISMPMPYQQPHAHVQFGGPSPQIQSQGVPATSLQMPMTLPVGNVPHQLFVPGLQSHPLQAQAMMHHGHGLSFAHQMGHQLAPQLGNMGIGIAPQFAQQQTGKFGTARKTTVKITHPETHEELRLDKRMDSYLDGGFSGQRQLPGVTPQSQPISSFTPHQINYYSPMQPNSYNPSSIFFPTQTSLPLTSTQMTMGSQVPRYNYQVGQSGQAISFNPSVLNPMPIEKSGTPFRGVSEPVNLDSLPISAPSAAVQVIVKPAVGSLVDKVVTPQVTVSMPTSKAEAPKLLRPHSEAIASHHQRNGEIGPESSNLQPKSVAEPSVAISSLVTDRHSTAVSSLGSIQIIQPGTSSSAPLTPVGDSGSVVAGTDGRRREPVQRSDSLKDHQKRPNKKDLAHSQQQHQTDPSDSAGGTKSSSLKISKDSILADLNTRQVSTNSEKIQAISGEDTSASTASLLSPTVECSVSSVSVEGKATHAASDSSGVMLEKKSSQGILLDCSDASELATNGIPIEERGPSETSISSGPEVDGRISRNLVSTSCQDDDTLLEDGPNQETVSAVEHGRTEVSGDSSQNIANVNVYPVSTITESSDGVEPTVIVKQEAVGAEDSLKAIVCETYEPEKEQLGTYKEAVSCCLEVDGTVEETDGPVSTSSVSITAEMVPSSHPSSANADEGKSSPPDAITPKSVIVCSQDVDLTDPGISHLEKIPVSAPVSSETSEKLEGKVSSELSISDPVSVIFSGSKDKPSLEATRTKTTGKKKKRREILSKADAAGTSDLYNAYKGPDEKLESANTTESIGSSLTVDIKQVPAGDLDKDVVASGEDGQSKAVVDDWEDAEDVSSAKLRSESGQKCYNDFVNEATSKKYTRDFLLTFSEQCTDLPLGFEIGTDVADALMSVPLGTSHVADREPYPSSGRIIDRSFGVSRVDRRMVGIVDDNKWVKAPVSFGPGRDLRLEVGHGAEAVSFRPGQGVNHGVLRNPRGQSVNQYVGGILSGPIQSLASQGGFPRNSVDADRWQRASGTQRGLIPSPQTPLPVMHKAEKKYEIGKVSDEEELKQRQLKAILNKLTPQNFEKLFEKVKEVNIDNAVTLKGVISQIFDKALMEPTFCEMYANFCLHLADELPDFSEDNEKITFKRLLLNKCQEEFERGEREQAEANRVEEEGEVKISKEEKEVKKIQARRRMLGNIRLIGELYKMKMLTERIMHECIKKLLGQYQNPDEEDLEALCKLMSTIGEMIDHSKAKEHMDAYFDVMLKLSTNQKLSSRVRFMLRDAIDLRKNRWQQRRKVDGPKKIEEVHRDAAQERQAQASRLVRGPAVSSMTRRGRAGDYGPRGPTVLSSPSSQQMGGARGFPIQVRGYSNQDIRLDDRHPFESRTLSVPLPQRSVDEDSITLGPQGGLARGMSIKGQPPLSSVPLADIPPSTRDSHRMVSAPNGYSSVSDWTPHNLREENMPRYMPDRFSGAPSDQSSSQDSKTYFGSRDSRNTDHTFDRSMTNMLPAGRIQGSLSGSQNVSSEATTLSEEGLREKSISAIREFYSAKDEGEVALCIQELNSPGFYSSMVSLWVTDSFERKDAERDLLAKLLVNLCNSQDNLISEVQLIEGFESVLSSLEDAVNDAPRAAEFLGRIFAKVVLEDVVPFKEIGRLIHEGGEEPGRLLQIGLASEVLGSILEIIRTEKGDSILNEIHTSSNLRLEDFRPPHPFKSKKLDAFL